MVLFVILLQLFICMGTIQIDKIYLISQIYQIIVVGMLKIWSYKYSNHYFIKFIGFLLIYYVINLDIVSLCMIFSICILNLLIYCKFE